MSDLRSQALAGAISIVNDSSEGAIVVANASLFLAFLEGSPVVAPIEKAKPVTAKAAEKAKPVKEEPKAEPEVEGPTADAVGAKINELLEANLRKQAVELLGKFKTKNASTLPADKRAEFIEAADALLMAG
jgi:hypothetical protein